MAWKYLRQYKWADMRQMLANNRTAQKRSDRSLTGQHCVITGCTSGVGWEAAQVLAAHGARLTMINRSREKSEQACRQLREQYVADCRYLLADFAKPAEVRAVAETLLREPDPIDILINNAGMFATRRRLTPDGLESVFCVNHLASFILTDTLLPKLKATPGARILQVNSQGHRFGGLRLDDLDWARRHYTGLRGYGAAKTAQLLCTWEFADLLKDSGVTCNAMHPGEVRSAIGENNGSLYRWYMHHVVDRGLKDPRIAGEAIHYLVTAPQLAHTTGRYFNLTHPETPAPHALDREAGRQVFAISRDLAEATRHPVADVLVVGGGMAGLTAAAYCAQAGKSVVLFEKGEVPGGLVNTFTRNGFTFDAGIRAIEDSGIVLPMLKQLGIHVDFLKSPVSIGIADKVIHVERPENLDDYGRMLKALYPENAGDVDAILQDIRKVMRYMAVLYGIENPLFKDLRHDTEYLSKTLLPWMGRFLATIGRINRMNEPAEEHLRAFTANPALIDIIAQHFFRKTPAFFAMSYFSLYLDYRYPRSGTGALPAALATYSTAHGAEIRCNTPITDVDPERRLVRTSTGEVHRYRQLVWAADQKALYRAVDEARITKAPLRARVRQRKVLIHDKQGGDSILSLHLALALPPAYFRAVSHGHFFHTPQANGIGTLFGPDLNRLIAQGEALRQEDRPSAQRQEGSSADMLAPDSPATGTLAPDLSAYRDALWTWAERYFSATTYEIAIPALRDETLAPPGQTGLMASVLMDAALFRVVRDLGWYDAFKQWCEACMIRTLTAGVYPQLADAIREQFSYTPLSLERITGNTHGAITGWAFTNSEIPAVSRFTRVATAVRTPLPNIHQAGQWTYSPSGLPISIMTGKLAADAALRGQTPARSSR